MGGERAGRPDERLRASPISCARRCCSSSRSCSGSPRSSSARASRPWCRRCWCAKRRWSRRASSRPTAPRCTRSTTTSSSSWARARCRSRPSTAARSSPPTASRAATSGSRRASDARPAPTARTPAASSGCTSSTRSRCSPTPTPRRSWDEHDALLAIEESIVGGLGLPYRVVNIAAGDLGAAAAKKYDVEVWLPSESARTASSRRARTTSTSRPAAWRHA